ncbi:MAG: hypothetical protein ACREA2_01765 [Blastocatellia bacterium]
MPTIEIEPEQLLNAASQMPEEELQRLIKINQGLAPADARRMKELIAKRQSYTITEDELQELIRLTDESERLNVERIKRLLELAHLRGVTLDEVMEQLGIKPAAA